MDRAQNCGTHLLDALPHLGWQRADTVLFDESKDRVADPVVVHDTNLPVLLGQQQIAQGAADRVLTDARQPNQQVHVARYSARCDPSCPHAAKHADAGPPVGNAVSTSPRFRSLARRTVQPSS